MDRRDFIKVGIGTLATLGVGEVIRLTPGDLAEAAVPTPEQRRRPGQPGIPKAPHDYRQAKRVPSVCLNCSTVCGIVGYVIDGKLVKVGGNPEDPNNGKTLCAKGQSTPTINYYPERILYPLKRVGKRGEGLWRRITWDEAYDELARRIRKCIDEGHPEQVAIHYGRSRISDVVERFQNAIGSPVILNHRALCSLNKRAANYSCIGDTDWETVDAEHSKYLLNFGSNFYEAHQGAIHFLRRVIRGRFDNGAKLVTFDVRLSNTAGRSDEWFAPFPGTEGAVALAMAHTMMKAGEYDREFIRKWTNVTPEALENFLEPYTPEWAAKQSGLAAKDIRRVALEFAKARPHCAAWTNRGSHAHYNGFNNDRAVLLLNALAGSIGKPGGYCYGEAERVDPVKYPAPAPQPPRPKIRTDLEDPPEWPIANLWQKMRVGQVVYDYLQQRRALLQVYLSYTLGSPQTWPEGGSLTRQVLLDEELIPFHACSDVVYSEMAHLSDLILPDAAYTERWGLDTRNNYELRPYLTLRQPIVPPPGECVHFADLLIELGKRCGPEVAKYFQFPDHAAYVAHQCKNIPPGDCASGFDFMRKHGVFVDMSQPQTYELFARPLTPAELKDATAARTGTDEQLRDVYYRKNAGSGQQEAVGVKVDGEVRRGFKTPSRKFEIYNRTVIEQSKKVGIEDDGWPHYVPVPSHDNLPEDRFIFTTFKWNVHTQARTAPQKFLSEIVHHNPMWIHTRTARKLGIKTGDWVEVTTYRPKGKTVHATGEKLGSVRVQAFVTEGIHPRVVAVSHSLGWEFGGRAAKADRAPRYPGPGYDPAVNPEDPDLTQNLWWDPQEGGAGPGFNVNAVLPIQPAPVTGMQAWFDTVCSLRKV